jgi:hypothetical protein
MIVRFMDSVAGTAVYINPDYVVSVRPDLANPTEVTQVKLSDGESLRVVGDHEDVARRLADATT